MYMRDYKKSLFALPGESIRRRNMKHPTYVYNNRAHFQVIKRKWKAIDSWLWQVTQSERGSIYLVFVASSKSLFSFLANTRNTFSRTVQFV